MQLRLVDRCPLRRNLSTQFAIDSPVVFANDFGGESVENQSKIAFECGSRQKSASKSILGVFGPRFYPLGGASGSSWVILGDPWGSLGRPWGAPGAVLEGLGAPPGLPGDPPGTLWDLPGLPGASGSRSGRVLTSKTTKNDLILIDFCIIFGTEIDGGCWWFVV